MSRGKHLSFEEARSTGKLEQFAKEHPSEAERARFKALLEAMSKGALEGEETSPQDGGADSSETRIPRDT